jgi:hypothetical protein
MDENIITDVKLKSKLRFSQSEQEMNREILNKICQGDHWKNIFDSNS